jgi:Tol biopolymer transport system component
MPTATGMRSHTHPRRPPGTVRGGLALALALAALAGADVVPTAQAGDATPACARDAALGADAAASACARGRTERVSVSSDGRQGNGDSGLGYGLALSAGGRFVAFVSAATNLVRGDTNGLEDIFVRDRKLGATNRVSVSSGGKQGNGGSRYPALSADGRFVAFESAATNLVKGDTNGAADIFVRDRKLGVTKRVSIATGGAQGDSGSVQPSLSADGRFVAFQSYATNLVPDDTNAEPDVFIHDRRTGVTKLVSVSSSGRQADSNSVPEGISAHGRFVAFWSFATNLVPGDTNDAGDVFVRDLRRGTTERISVSSGGEQGDGSSTANWITGDGRFVAFASWASNLVPGDTNGAVDFFVRDRRAGTTERVSVSSGGEQGDGDVYVDSVRRTITRDGRFVVFPSYATNLVPDDTNDQLDVFVRDRVKGITTRVSVSAAGAQGASGSVGGTLSGQGVTGAQGRFVAFESVAPNLVKGDTNGAADIFVRTR